MSAPALLTPDEAKNHLRVDGGADDAAIAAMVLAAGDALEGFLGRPIIDADRGWATPADVPPAVIHAVKVVLADLYQERNTPLTDMTSVRMLVGRYMAVSVG